jgi:hypothetical protein
LKRHCQFATGQASSGLLLHKGRDGMPPLKVSRITLPIRAAMGLIQHGQTIHCRDQGARVGESNRYRLSCSSREGVRWPGVFLRCVGALGAWTKTHETWIKLEKEKKRWRFRFVGRNQNAKRWNIHLYPQTSCTVRSLSLSIMVFHVSVHKQSFTIRIHLAYILRSPKTEGQLSI